MDVAIIESAKQVIRSGDVPPALVQLANSLYFQSTSAIPLKPNQEPARAHICSVLAAEVLGEKLGLSPPDTRTPPIQPSQYTKLLQQFRSVLCPNMPATPSKRNHRQRSARAKAVEGLRNELDEPSYFDDGDDDDNFNDLEDDLSDYSEPESSPSKRAPSASQRVSPRKSPRKSLNSSPQKPARLFSGRKRPPGPTIKLVDEIGVRMGLNRVTIDAVKLAFERYLELVKDGWGLVYGLFVVVSERAEPRVGAAHEQELRKSLRALAPRVEVDGHEWINWVQQIVTGQSWIMEIGPREPQPVLAGAPGGWFQ